MGTENNGQAKPELEVKGEVLSSVRRLKGPWKAAFYVTAVSAMRKGSYHFLAKPLKLDEIRNTVRNALQCKSIQLDNRGPCSVLSGRRGTGKTSLGRSIAESMQRRFISISLAGMKDEAQLRGHRRSYVGALPGRIIQEIRRSETCNPVFVLDELDKISQEFKGDPAAALLEVLDPQQNTHFMITIWTCPLTCQK